MAKDIDILFYDKEVDRFDGDLKIRNNDIDLAYDREVDKQEAVDRLNTNNPDWYNHYLVGADLEDLRGMDQKPETAELGKRKIINSFTHDKKFGRNNIYIESIPTAMDEITYFIFLNKGTDKEIMLTHKVYL